jgi:hypothetical protein
MSQVIFNGFIKAIDGKKVQIKISEFDPKTVKKIRQKSGYDDNFMIQ